MAVIHAFSLSKTQGDLSGDRARLWQGVPCGIQVSLWKAQPPSEGSPPAPYVSYIALRCTSPFGGKPRAIESCKDEDPSNAHSSLVQLASGGYFPAALRLFLPASDSLSPAHACGVSPRSLFHAIYRTRNDCALFSFSLSFHSTSKIEETVLLCMCS